MSDGRVCAVCARVLNHDSFRGWTHTLQDAAPEDHPPVPVRPDEVHTVTRCDFCSQDAPAWTVPARTFTALPGHGSDGDWAACDDCVHLIQENKWSALADRIVRIMRRQGLSADAEPLHHLYSALRRHLRGAPYRTSEGPGPR